MRIIFTENALSEYIAWQQKDKKTLKKINQLIQDIQRNGLMSGIGKPAPLKGLKAFSRRIDDKNILVYIGDANQDLVILSCRGHYEN